MLATVTSKAQITLPKDVRTLLQLQPGDKIAFLPTPDGKIVVTKASKTSFASLRGILPQPRRAHTIEEMNQAVHAAAASKNTGRKRGTVKPPAGK